MDFKDPKAQKMVLAGMAMAGVGYLYFFASFVPFGYRAMSAEKKELQSKYEQLSSDLNKARQTLSSMNRVEAEFEAIQKRWQAAERLLPEQKEVANLLRMVSLVGQQSGITFELFKPMPAVPMGYYIENPVDVKVTGGYHEIGEFLADVANLSRIVKVSNLTLTNYDKGDTDETVHAAFTASAYTLNPDPPAEEPAGKESKTAKEGRAGGSKQAGKHVKGNKEALNEIKG
jgi:type IV pilus assembly protein PilO